MAACYLGQSLPPLVDMCAKYTTTTTTTTSSPHSTTDIWKALLENANVGGENVHRGSVLGAILGARAGMEGIPKHLREGLYNHDELADEIDDFVVAVLGKQQRQQKPHTRTGTTATTSSTQEL